MKRIMFVCSLALICFAGAVRAKTAEVSPLAGKTVPELGSILNDSKDEAMRLEAARVLSGMMPKSGTKGAGSRENAVKILMQGLYDTSSGVRYECRKGLGCGGEVALEALIIELKSTEPDVRSYAADALGDMGTCPDAVDLPLEKAVPALQKALRDKDYRVRVSAAMALWRIGGRSAPALSDLIKLLKDDEWAVIDAAVRAVPTADPSGKKSVPALIKVLRNRKHDLREFVCNELADMGQNAKPAIPALIKLLDADADSWYAGKAAAGALVKIINTNGGKQSTEDKLVDERPKVIAALAKSVATQKVPFVVNDRMSALFKCECEIGPEVLPALPVLKQRLKDWIYAPMRPVVPRRELESFLVRAGKNDKENTIAFVKELIADEKVDQDKGLKELNNLLKELEVEK